MRCFQAGPVSRFLPAVAVALSVSAIAAAYDTTDFQLWNTDSVELKALPVLKAAAEAEFRWGDDMSEFFYQHFDGGVQWTTLPFVSMGGGYRHISELKKGNFKVEQEPYATLTLSVSLLGFGFETRSRQEFRHFDYAADSWRYRNRVAVKFPAPFGLKPYLADEVLVGFGTVPCQLAQNRVNPGCGFPILGPLSGELYYMLVNTRSGVKWPSANVLGVKAKLSF